MIRYIEKVAGITNRGIVSSIDCSNFNIDLYSMNAEGYYASAFMFEIGILDHVREKHSVAGYNGYCSADALYWDIDNSNLFKSLEDGRELISRLESMAIPEDSIRIFFSGNKGLHIFVLSSDLKKFWGVDFNKVMKLTCAEIAEGLESFDNSVYDKTRIIRVCNSIHEKSKLYKIPLTYEQIKTITPEELIQISKFQVKHDKVYTETSNEIIQSILERSNTNILNDLVKKNNNRQDYSNNMINGIINGFTEGGRNKSLTQLAGLLHSKNLGDVFVSAVLTATNNKSPNPLPQNEIDTIVKSVSRYSVNPEHREIDEKKIFSMKDSAESWYRTNLNRPIINTGYQLLDCQLKHFVKGTVLGIGARPGVAKTTWAMQIANNIATNLGENALFFSMEMQKETIFYRASSITFAKDSPLYDDYTFEKDMIENESIRNAFASQWENLHIVDEDTMDLKRAEAYLNTGQELERQKNGKPYGLVLFDYFNMLEGTDDYHKISKIARELKNFSKRNNVRIIMLFQFNRSIKDFEEPDLDSARDSGAIEEGLDFYYGLWKQEGDESRINAKKLKNRYATGGDFRFILRRNGLYLTDERWYEQTKDYMVPRETPGKWG